MPLQDSDLQEFVKMWTTERENYVLTDDRQALAGGQRMGYGIFELSPNGELLCVLIEDALLHDAVAQKMLEANVTVLPSARVALSLARSRAGRPE